MNDELIIQFYSSEPITVHTSGNMKAHISTTITSEDLFKMLKKLPKEILMIAFEEVGFKIKDETINTNLVEDNQDILGLTTEEKLNLAYQQIQNLQSQIAKLEARKPVCNTLQDNLSNSKKNEQELEKLREESKELKQLREEYRILKKKFGRAKNETNELIHDLKKTISKKEEKLATLLRVEKKKSKFLRQYLKDNGIRYQDDFQEFISNLYLYSRYRTGDDEDAEYDEDDLDDNADFWR